MRHHLVLRPARTAAWLASVLLLLLAQWLMVTHVHADEHGHGEEDGELPCTVCLFKAAGHEQLAPPKGGAATLLPPPRAATPAEPAVGHVPQGWRTPRLARGPPVPSPVS